MTLPAVRWSGKDRVRDLQHHRVAALFLVYFGFAHRVGHVLVQLAAIVQRDHLHAQADAKRGHVARFVLTQCIDRLKHGQFECLALRINAPRLGMGRFAERFSDRVHPAGEDDAIAHGDIRPGQCRLMRQQQRYATGFGDAAAVMDRLLILAGRRGIVLVVHRDADDRSCHADDFMLLIAMPRPTFAASCKAINVAASIVRYNPFMELAHQQCINPDCAATFGVDEAHVACPQCASLLDVRYDWQRLAMPRSLAYFEYRWNTKGEWGQGALDFSGVWRFRELMPFYRSENEIVTIGEGRTNLQDARLLAREIGLKPGNLYLQYEGLNPSGSFKDNGMTAAFTHARMVGARRVACASTGNTSASLAMFASLSGMTGIVFIGSGKIAYGKLSQALDYGARTLQIQGDFDDCLRRIRQIVTERKELGIYLMNSVNPFRIEGQKSIMYRALEAMNWQPPDWIIVPGGNLGNCSAFGKAFAEMHELGLIDRIPRLAVVQAAGANPLHELVNNRGLTWNDGRFDLDKVKQYYREQDNAQYKARTIASAIEIGRPVNLPKALRALHIMDGVVREVDDQTILEHKAMVGRFGFGCEPASAASVAGAHQLIEEGVISNDERVVCILTGHELKDPDATVKYHTGIDMKAVQETAPRAEPQGRFANQPHPVPDDLEAIIEAIGADVGTVDVASAGESEEFRHLPVQEY